MSIEASAKAFLENYKRVREEIHKVIVGHDEIVPGRREENKFGVWHRENPSVRKVQFKRTERHATGVCSDRFDVHVDFAFTQPQSGCIVKWEAIRAPTTLSTLQ